MAWPVVFLALLADAKPRELFEVGPEDQETGLEPFYDGNMEPWGVVCVGYVNEGSANHQLLQKLGAVTEESDEILWELQVPMIAAKDWQEQETLHLVRRNYAAKLWEMIQLPPLDSDPVVFPGDGKWKEKEVRKWLMENAFPTINYRIPGYQGKKQPFPFNKYFGSGNAGGVGLVMVKIKDLNDFGPQFRAIRYMRPHIEKLSGQIRFAILEKSESTLEMRTALKVGLNESIEAELVLFENLDGVVRKVDNHFHGNKKKYRLLNLTEDAVNRFFEAYYAGHLPTYWASKDEGKAKSAAGQLRAWDFEEKVFKADPKTAVLVAFMNAPEDGCAACTEGRSVWASVMHAVQLKSQLRKRFQILWLDQSRDEHPEELVPGRLGQPMVVYYPPGDASKRRKRKMLLHRMSQSFFKDYIIEMLEDMLEDQEDGEEL